MRIMYPAWMKPSDAAGKQLRMLEHGSANLLEAETRGYIEQGIFKKAVFIARRGQHTKIHRKEQHHAQTHQEARQRNAQHRQHRHKVIGNRAALLRRQHSARNRNQDGDELRIDGEQDGRLEVAGNHFADRLIDDGG